MTTKNDAEKPATDAKDEGAKTAPKASDNNKRLAELEDRARAAKEPVTASDATDLETAIVLVNALKAQINGGIDTKDGGKN